MGCCSQLLSSVVNKGSIYRAAPGSKGGMGRAEAMRLLLARGRAKPRGSEAKLPSVDTWCGSRSRILVRRECIASTCPASGLAFHPGCHLLGLLLAWHQQSGDFWSSQEIIIILVVKGVLVDVHPLPHRPFCFDYLCVKLTQARIIREERTSVEKMLPPVWPVMALKTWLCSFTGWPAITLFRTTSRPPLCFSICLSHPDHPVYHQEENNGATCNFKEQQEAPVSKLQGPLPWA